MLWRGVDITTFPSSTVWKWLDQLEGEKEILQAELDRRTIKAAKRTDPPTDRGAPPRRGEDGG